MFFNETFEKTAKIRKAYMNTKIYLENVFFVNFSITYFITLNP